MICRVVGSWFWVYGHVPKAPAQPVPSAHSHEGLNVEGWEDGSRAPSGRKDNYLPIVSIVVPFGGYLIGS